MKISSTLPSSNDWAQSVDFENFLESHLTYIVNNHITDLREITEDFSVVYKGDFYGLMNACSIPIDMHYILMRVNGFTSSADYDGTPFVLRIPSLNEITILRNVFKTNHPMPN